MEQIFFKSLYALLQDKQAVKITITRVGDNLTLLINKDSKLITMTGTPEEVDNAIMDHLKVNTQATEQKFNVTVSEAPKEEEDKKENKPAASSSSKKPAPKRSAPKKAPPKKAAPPAAKKPEVKNPVPAPAKPAASPAKKPVPAAKPAPKGLSDLLNKKVENQQQPNSSVKKTPMEEKLADIKETADKHVADAGLNKEVVSAFQKGADEFVKNNPPEPEPAGEPDEETNLFNIED